MTTKQDLAKRMAAAAGGRQDGRKPEGRTALRTKPVRITADLDPALYNALHRWLAEAVEVGEPRLTVSGTVQALIAELVGGSSNLEALIRARMATRR